MKKKFKELFDQQGKLIEKYCFWPNPYNETKAEDESCRPNFYIPYTRSFTKLIQRYNKFTRKTDRLEDRLGHPRYGCLYGAKIGWLDHQDEITADAPKLYPAHYKAYKKIEAMLDRLIAERRTKISDEELEQLENKITKEAIRIDKLRLKFLDEVGINQRDPLWNSIRWTPDNSEIARAFPEEKKIHWEYDTATGEEQQTLIPKEPKTDKGEFIGDLFSYDE